MFCPIQSKDNAEVLLAYTNRALDPDTMAVLERHMESCPDCRHVAETQRAVWAALDAWDAMPVSSDFDTRLYQRIAEEGRTGWWRRVFRPMLPLSWKPIMPVAAACMTLLAIFLIRAPDQTNSMPAARTETALDAEQVERSLEDLEMLRVLTRPAQKTELPGSQIM